MASSQNTVIHKFVHVATDPATSAAQSLECCGDALTYAQLLAHAHALAEDLRTRFGEKPTVAIISENHPYVLAVILAVWLLGGVAAPLDYHAPEPLMRGMLDGVQPSCVVLPETAEGNVALVTALGLVAHTFAPAESGIPHLLKKYAVSHSAPPAIDASRLPDPDADAIFLYTSSASSASNLKCVPINHGTLYANAALELAKWRARRPARVVGSDAAPERFRVLGWGPFSHIMALAHDFTCHCVLVAGCYVFGVPPSTYPLSESAVDGAGAVVARPAPGQNYDVGEILLQTAARAQTDMFAGVPWVFRRLMEACARRPEWLGMLQGFRQLLSGGALTDDEIQRWAKDAGLQLEISIGMTELAGALFETDMETMADGGYPESCLLVADAELILVDEEDAENDTYGELLVRSKYISKGYRNFASTSHTTDAAGVTTFRTGDLYSRADARLTWEGRREDFIQLASAELLDPRIPESALAASPYIARAALVGNRFLRGAADFVCALVELPAGGGTGTGTGFKAQEIVRAFARVNRTLSPPLRVPVSRVLVLREGETLPMTRKQQIWRKALEERFGERMKALLADPGLSRFAEARSAGAAGAKGRPRKTLEEVERELVGVVAEGLGISQELLDSNSDATFAELGMDSNMATRIVSTLNSRFALDLPMSACHDYVDLAQLAAAITDKLNSKTATLGRSLGAHHSATSSAADDDDIVIVGQAFRLPGRVNDSRAFWRALVERRTDVLEHMGNDRWDHTSFYAPPGSALALAKEAGTINFTQMGRIEVASYDNAFFGISPAEAYFVTPSARCALEVSVEALEDANIPLAEVKGTDLAVFVAQGPEFGFSDLIYEEKGFKVYDRYYGTGVADSAISGRLSYFLDVHGPSVTLNTACSGGLVALDNACMSIRHGSSEMAIVCSVNVHVWPGNFSFLSANQMSSLHGRCATFSKDADGYVPSEGAMAFVVKSKKAALRDGDKILGVVKSTSVRHNGRSQGLVAPNSKAQVMLQRNVLAAAGITAADVDFVENHGTGTILGDMMEIQAINEVFAGSHSAEAPLVLGAAKTVFGHTESSAGLVGVAKALQTLQHGVVPGLAHLDGTNLSPRLDTTVTPLHISHLPTTLQHRASGVPLRALSLSFGFAGTIAAVILEEYQPPKPKPKPKSEPALTDDKASDARRRPVPHLFVVSAKTEKALLAYLRSYRAYCKEATDDADLPDICYTACVGREHYRFRFACVCTTLGELVAQIDDALARAAGAAKTPVARAIAAKPRVAFAFPGQGSQWQGMAGAMCELDETFEACLLDYAGQAGELLKIDLVPILLDAVADGSTPGASLVNETHISQACIFVFQCAMVQWLGAIGVRPSAILTHSLGEIAAAVASKAMDFRTALEFVVVRSNAMRPENTNGGRMAALRAPSEPIMKRIASLGLSSTVGIAAYNSDTQHVVSGDEQGVRKLVEDLAAKSIKGTVLSVNQGFHSQCIDSSLGPIREFLERQGDSLGQPSIPYYSSVEGRTLKAGERLDADYWVKQARNPVRFSSAAKVFLSEGNYQAILDVGPQNVIAHLLKDASTRTPTDMAISHVCDRPATNTLSPLMQSLATLFMLGVTPDFQKLYAGRRVRAKKISIPTYPWQRQRHYPTIIPSRTGAPNGSHQNDSYSRSWEIGKELGPLLEKNHTLDSVPIIPAAALAMFVSLEARKARSGTFTVDLRILKPVLLETPGQDVLKLDIRGDSFTCTHLQGTVDKGAICSGKLRPASSAPSMSTVANGSPDSAMDKTATYDKFADNLVQFGPNFQCIQKIEFWPEHASAVIEVPSSGDAQHDFVRKMDAILHMFGAIAPEGPDELKAGGSFLPSAVSGFTLHADALPERFTCRYRLPITVAPNAKRMTAVFEVRSEAGALLASCTDYSVSWIPSSMPIARRRAPKDGIPLMRTTWTQKTLDASTTLPPSSELVYAGSGRVKEALEAHGKSGALNLHVVDDIDAFFKGAKREGTYYVVFDAVPLNDTQVSEATMTSSSTAALDFVKAVAPHLRSQKVAGVVVLTQNALQILPGDVSGSLAPGPQNTASCLLGSFVQGMIRVLRQEASSQLVTALDIPSSIFPSEACSLMLREFANPASGRTSPIAYRLSTDRKLIRLESCLVEDGYWTPAPKKEAVTKARKCAVIVGMGDIGIALAERMIEAGWSAIVFIGRRSRGDVEVASTLINLETDDVELRYIEADVTSYSLVRGALEKINSELGPIHSIVHTAGIVKDSLIGSTSHQDAVAVMKPKALGAWNLHLACEELKINVERFVMLSSISVPLGKPGQLSYVSASAFMDALAGYRTSLSPSTARSYSIQLGAWESRLTSEGQVDDAQAILDISNAQGMPLLLNVLEGDEPLPAVPVLAKMRFGLLRGKGTFSSDPYFAAVINAPVEEVAPKVTSSVLPTRPAQISIAAVESFVAVSLQTILGMTSSDFESLDSSTPVLSLGIDSISFTQLRADVLKKYEVDLPMTFLGEDTLTMGDLAEFIVDKAKELRGSDKNSSTDTLVSESSVSAKDAETFISGSLQTVLGVSASDIDSSTPVLSLGIDSISFTQLRADVLKKYDVDIPMTFLGEDTLTLSELAEYTVEKAKEAKSA